jgi:hypothetical protein
VFEHNARTPTVAMPQHARLPRAVDNGPVTFTAPGNPQMSHTYLFQPAVWTGSGTFWCADGQSLPAECRTEVAHRTECWLLSGTLKVLGSPPVEFVNAYWIEVPGRSGAALKLHGTFSVIGSSILSVYHSESAGYHGADHLRRIDDDNYESTGMLLLESRRLSSWQVLLKRQSA